MGARSGYKASLIPCLFQSCKSQSLVVWLVCAMLASNMAFANSVEQAKAAPLVRGRFLNESTFGLGTVTEHCDVRWRYLRAAAASLDFGFRCAASSVWAWEAAPQISWDSTASGLAKISPALRLKVDARFNLQENPFSHLDFSFSYVVAPSGPRNYDLEPGFHPALMRRWWDVWDSRMVLSWTRLDAEGRSGWVFEVLQSVPSDLRFGGIESFSALDFMSVGAERVWLRDGWRVSAGVGAMSVRIDNIRISFLMPRVGFLFDF